MIPYQTHKILIEHTFNLGFTNLRWIFPYYTFFMFLGILAGLFLIQKKIKKLKEQNLSLTNFIKIFIICAISTMVGGRLFYLLFYKTPKPFYLIFVEMFTIWKAGMVSIGGFLFLIITLILVLKKHKISFLKFMDLVSPSFAIGMFFARIGCFFTGCCIGLKTNVPWAILHENTLLHPTQIYSSFYNLIIFIILYFISSKKYPKGIIFFSYISLYGLSRFIVEFFRKRPFLIFNLSIQQVTSLMMLIIGIIFIINTYYKKTNQIHKI